MSLLDNIRSLFGSLTAAEPPRFGDDDYRVAAAALLVHAASVDGTIADAERMRLAKTLGRAFALEPDATAQLIEAGIRRERESTDFAEFTSTLVRALDPDQRARIVRLLWKIARADGVVHEFEESLIERVASLLDVPNEAKRPKDEPETDA